MPDYRRIQTIAGRFDVEHARHPDSLRRWRSRVTWAAGAIGLIIVLVPVMDGDHRSVQSRPLTTAHQLFAQDCKACHDVLAQPVLRIIPGNDHARSVSIASCGKCHHQQIHDHHPESMIREVVQNCVQCHQEHRGKDTLQRVASPHCVRCHKSLETKTGPSKNFAAVNSFRSHPEFALRRDWSGSSGSDPALGKFHLMLQRARLESNQTTGKKSLRDATTLKFNHRVHLDPNGVLLPPNMGRSTEILDCASCHEAESTGAYMKPISYEQHCQRCHQLNVSEKFQWVTRNKQAPLPHGDVSLIRGILRDRLTEYANANPEKLASVERPSIDRTRLPQKRRDPGKPEASTEDKRTLEHKKWQWVDDQLKNVGEDVFQRIANSGAADPGASRLIATSCIYCHTVTREKSKSTDFAWAIAPPKVPRRWFPHSRFRHDRHLMVNCVDCHYKTVPEAGVSATNLDKESIKSWYASRFPQQKGLTGSVFDSQTSKDILVPSISTCRNCHGSQSKARRSGRARSDCIECHNYHARPILSDGTSILNPRASRSRSLREFLETDP